MKNLSVIIPSFHSEDLTCICVKSFEKFKPENLSIHYIVVENSDNISYKDEILGCAKNITWINNPTSAIGSEANAEAIDIGLIKVNTEWVFLCHCDICVCSNLFFKDLFKKVAEGYKLIGTVCDPIRIQAIHVSGYLTTIDLANKVSPYPVYIDSAQILDVGDSLTKYCRDNDIKHYCFKNTFNCPEIIESLNENYRDFKVDRCVNDNCEVIFMHLGRGIPKTNKTYKKIGRVDVDGWDKFCTRILND